MMQNNLRTPQLAGFAHRVKTVGKFSDFSDSGHKY